MARNPMTRTTRSNARTTVFSLLIALIFASVVHACPTCKEAVSENGGNLVQGYFWSIIFMMSMPFIILASLSTMFYLDVRRARRRLAEQAELAIGGV